MLDDITKELEEESNFFDFIPRRNSELELILEEARELDVTPRIGLRARLASVGKGKWQNTGGEKSKFGLTASQILEVVETLRAQDALASLQLVHFHLGSQIANIRAHTKRANDRIRMFRGRPRVALQRFHDST